MVLDQETGAGSKLDKYVVVYYILNLWQHVKSNTYYSTMYYLWCILWSVAFNLHYTFFWCFGCYCFSPCTFSFCVSQFLVFESCLQRPGPVVMLLLSSIHFFHFLFYIFIIRIMLADIWTNSGGKPGQKHCGWDKTGDHSQFK